MDRQPKLRPATRSAFFANGISSQLPVEGTIARSDPYEDNVINTGLIPGTTNFVETIPVPVTPELMARGRQRFTINCSPCHGPDGDGKGITLKYGMVAMANLHDARMVTMPAGQIFNTITYGKNFTMTSGMGPYGANVTIPDRWAIIAYIRALQRSQLATIEDVPEAQRAQLK